MAQTKSEKIAAGKKRHGFSAVNKPRRGGSKKFEVLAVEGDSVKYIAFGDPNMEIRKDNPAARKSFRARHKCDTATSKLTARYWSCKKW
tara:strand:+ start:1115 stop:1381 length:267 start_codon:yes stop_codon:yes gene_type:complete